MLEVRILGNQPEPSLVQAGLEIIDFEVRCKDEDVFEQGKMLIEHYVDQNPELEGCQLIIDDPMSVGLYPSHDENGNMYDADNVSPYYFDELVKELEDMGFYGKAAGYKESK
jgi:protein involved in sex pheromone biosynthesis